ncbi:hypothetical protein ACOQFV_27420 [Nocardiopsis changdeensis]|uniref:ANTAR domain-containing protein n=1 Tax=Nocardiopsis changdeensis TaxID=2831969 RepID=A0ABX8BL93_9ACTN|nr:MULTISPECIES: hypothetical protein [Nocardiopsis]QUX22999.1 hypothetical protein KGD84_00880 [Nocardiopsis changdeensis]QYX38942.1 hypothetical protein K1J57_10330 [Nocardiopsis sp. MT53]
MCSPTTAELAARAQQLHATSARSSLERKAAGCAAVVLTDARSITGARRMLRTSNLPDDLRDATLDLIDQLAARSADPPQRR